MAYKTLEEQCRDQYHYSIREQLEKIYDVLELVYLLIRCNWILLIALTVAAYIGYYAFTSNNLILYLIGMVVLALGIQANMNRGMI